GASPRPLTMTAPRNDHTASNAIARAATGFLAFLPCRREGDSALVAAAAARRALRLTIGTSRSAMLRTTRPLTICPPLVALDSSLCDVVPAGEKEPPCPN